MNAQQDLGFEDLMKIGHEALQGEKNDDAARLFQQASTVTTTLDQLSSALQMEGVAYRKLGHFQEANRRFDDASNVATSALQKGKVLRDHGMNFLDTAQTLSDQRLREEAYDDAEVTLQKSHDLLVGEHETVEAAATLGFQGRVAYKRGFTKAGRHMMRNASRGLSGNPVYKLNNLVWLMLASPADRFRLSQAILLVLANEQNRSVGALARVLATLGGPRLYDGLRKKFHR